MRLCTFAYGDDKQRCDTEFLCLQYMNNKTIS
jgi:hypothetical protein